MAVTRIPRFLLHETDRSSFRKNKSTINDTALFLKPIPPVIDVLQTDFLYVFYCRFITTAPVTDQY